MKMSLKSLLPVALLFVSSMAFAYGQNDDCDHSGRDCGRPGWDRDRRDRDDRWDRDDRRGGGHHGPGHGGPGYPPPRPRPPGPGYPPPPPPYYPPAPQYIQLECSSGDYRYRECYVGGRIVSVTMRAQYSGAACIANQTWGAQYDRIWVNNGCRALFQVQVAR